MYRFKRKINFYDSDPAGILFFAKAFEIAHTAYEGMIEDAKLSRNYFIDEEYAIPLLHAEAEFLKPVRVGELLTIEVVVTQVRTSSFELSFLFINDKNENKVKLKTIHLFVDKKTFEKKGIPDEFKKCLIEHLHSTINT